MAIEIRADRADSAELAAYLAPLNHQPTALAVRAERMVSRLFGGSCQIPLAAHATLEGEVMRLRAMVATPDGTQMASADLSGPASAPEVLGEQVASVLRAQGADAILQQCKLQA